MKRDQVVFFMNPTITQSPLFSMPRGSVLSIDNIINSSDGVWIHVFQTVTNRPNSPTDPSGSLSLCFAGLIEWILAGKRMDNPICIPLNKSVWMSRFKKGKAYHIVKRSPSREEPIKVQVPGGFAIIADEVITNAEGMWARINIQTLYQFNVPTDAPMYVCLMLDQNVLFDKIYGRFPVC